MSRFAHMMVWLSAVILAWGQAAGQSSSLFVTQPVEPAEFAPPPTAAATVVAAPIVVTPPAPIPAQTPQPARGQPSPLSPAIAQASLVAVQVPEPRRFAVHDLITVVIRESIENNADAELDTSKDSSFKGEIKSFPTLTLADLLNAQIKGGSGGGNTPKLDVGFKSDFKGDGSYKRRDTFTTRITASIIDVKPNGNLVVEARKFIQSDRETVTLILSGTCRAEDIAADNTVLSTQLFDLRLIKEHTGELRQATRKGVLTKLLEGVFNF
jgi:flagellar L-ring protein precursor FlgH